MQEHGFHDSLAPLLDSGQIPWVIDPERACAVADSRPWWKFW